MTIFLALTVMTKKFMAKKLKITPVRKIFITSTMNASFFLGLILAYYHLNSSFQCSLLENAVFGTKKTHFICIFTNFLISQVILAIGMFTVLVDSVLEIMDFFMHKRTQTLKRLGNRLENVSPKSAVRKAWASKKFEETVV